MPEIQPATLAIGLLLCALALFIWGRWRYDVVAVVALLVGVIVGVVPARGAFAGFGHPAVITVAAVLVISRALSTTGAVDALARLVARAAGSAALHAGALGGLAAAISAFMNNVGALALMMPVAIQSALKADRSPATVLMPLSFASILGGLVTLIGTPPNIIVASYRAEVADAPFRMFDFTPVGLPIAILGVAFVALVGWRLIPKERRSVRAAQNLFEIESYLTEARVPEGARAAGKLLSALDEIAEKEDAEIIALVRGERRMLRSRWRWRVEPEDVLVIEAAPEAIDKAVAAMGLELVGSGAEILKSDDVTVVEAVVTPGAPLEGRSPETMRLRTRYGINLLAVSRQGKPYRGRLKAFGFQAGDVLLLQGDVNNLPDVMSALGCLPLAERGFQLRRSGRQAALAIGIFAVAIGLTAAGLLPAQIALLGAVAVMILVRVISPRELYDSIDWPVIILLGAMIPIGGALESTGGTELISGAILDLAATASAAVILALVLVVTMTLSDIVNNAATAVVMAPIAYGIALQLGVNPDAFLMAVAVGASCAFLTPIGHQNNTLVMGPGGYHFGDYWRMGLPLEALILAAGVPLIVWIWGL